MINDNSRIREITIVGLMVALLAISAYISFPIPFTPILITAQTIIINIIGLTLSPKLSVTTIITFLFLGAIGLPIFSGGKAGVGTLIGPSGGYLFGFLIAVLGVSYCRGKMISIKKYLFLTIIIAMPIIYLFGAAWMSYYNGATIMETVKLAIIPFIPGDIIKAVIASFIAVRLNKVRLLS